MINKNNKIDPKELKILSDILALVLEEQSGQSISALETIKKRAKNNGVTGGALKNLFSSIANNPPPNSKPTPSQDRSTSGNSNELLKARARVNELIQGINRLDSTVRSLKSQNESLRFELLQTQKSRAEIQAQLHASNAKPTFRSTFIIISLLCGLFCGIAGTIFISSVAAPPPPTDNTIYLH